MTLSFSNPVRRKSFMQKRSLCCSGFAAALLLASCGNPPGENEAKMTSYTASESKADTAELFSVSQEQMAHIKIASVERSNFPRVLRFTGSVAYNAFKTTPVFSPVGGPVQEILVTPGQTVKAGQPLLTVTSPDYSVARKAFLRLPIRTTKEPRTSTNIKPLPSATCCRPNRTARLRKRIWFPAKTLCAPSESRIPPPS